MEDHLWKKAITYTRAFQRTHMTCHEANVLYWACFLPALTYPFPAMWLSEKFLERIQTLSTSTILNKMGLHCNLPQSLVFAPWDIGGMGLCNLSHEQSVQQVIILVQHLCAKTMLGNAIELLIRTYQLWAGLSHHIDPSPLVIPPPVNNAPQPHPNLVQLMDSSQTASPGQTPYGRLCRKNYLMVQLEQINACRMYLKVTTLAEITDHTGTKLLPQAFPNPNCLENINLDAISTSLLQWPHIAKPSTASWQLWNNTIHTIYTGCKTGTRLQSPLGEWLPTYAQQ